MESEGPLGAEIVEFPVSWARLTVLPDTATLLAFFRVTVIKEELLPSATTEVRLATTVDVVASVNDDVISKAAEVAEVKPGALATRV